MDLGATISNGVLSNTNVNVTEDIHLKMEQPRHKTNRSEFEKANLFSLCSLRWFWRVFFFRSTGELKKTDLWDPADDDKAEQNATGLGKEWESSLLHENSVDPEKVKLISIKPGKDTLFDALKRTYMRKYFLAWPFIIYNDCFLRVLQPWLMLLLIRSFIDDVTNQNFQYLYAAGLCVVTILLSLTNNPCLFYLARVGQRCRIALASLVQRKVVKISAGSQKTDQGQIITLISNDAAYVEAHLLNIPYLVVAPIQLLIFMGFLWHEFGISSIAGLVFIAVYMPFQCCNLRLSSKYRKSIGKKTDKRTRILTEVICGINSVKLYAWEYIFKSIVEERRKAEVEELGKRSRLHALQMSIFLTSSRVIPFLTFLSFVLCGGSLTADRVFYAIAVYNTVTHYMLFLLPAGIRGLGEIRGSLQRIEKFLLMDEKPKNERLYKRNLQKNVEINLSEVTASYSRNHKATQVLSNISCKLQQKQLVMIVGKLGSGKSSFLRLLLNELYIKSGKATINGTFSYSSEESYVFPGTTKQNIIFHGKYNEKRYNKVITASGLSDEIKQFTEDDPTNVVKLSGGHQARIHLARALYRDADIYILDDPLVAVSTQLSKQIFETAVKTFLRDKLRILVTHQRHYLHEADHIIVLDEEDLGAKPPAYIRALNNMGEVWAWLQQDFESIKDSATVLTTYHQCICLLGRLPTWHGFDWTHEKLVYFRLGKILAQGIYTDVENHIENLFGPRNYDASDVDTLLSNNQFAEDLNTNTDKQTHTIIQIYDSANAEVKKSTGAFGFRIFWKYFSCGKSMVELSIYLLLFVIAQVFTTLIGFWLAIWTNAEEYLYESSVIHTKLTDNPSSEESDYVDYTEHSLDAETESFDTGLKDLESLDRNVYLCVYLTLVMLVFLTNLAKAIAFFNFSMKICTNIHDKMLECLLRAKPSFFDEHYTGRIINRFTKDLGTIDEQIPFAIFDMWTILLQVVTVILLVIFAIWYSVFIIILFLLALYVVQNIYVSTSRQLKRFEGNTRSPVISHVQTTFTGLVTIRALNAEEAINTHFDNLQDENTAASISYLAASHFFNISIELLATLLLSFVSFGFLIAQNYYGQTFLGGNVGVAVCSAMSLTIWLQYGMKIWANLENLMVSVERALEYTTLKPEAKLNMDEDEKLPTSWPTQGFVDFDKITLSYDNDKEFSDPKQISDSIESGAKNVLKELSFSIKANEKIGIVGKTGAGKSSVLRALFRMTEIKKGRILVDNVNISELGLHTLRKNLAIIPQCPHLFNETLAFNLDPRTTTVDRNGERENKKQMEKILKVIGLNKNLNEKVNGEQYSIGERQLVSLARILILQKKIVCMDEATAHVDSGTNYRIHKILRKELANSTVFTIAHRLWTVIKYDRILVISDGKLAEFDHPHELLKNPDGQLSQMVNNMGKDAEKLREAAERAWSKRQQLNGIS